MEITIDNVTKVYRGGVHALDGVSLTFGNGIFGLLGPNGAGKTTLMRVLATLIQPTNGEVTIGEYDLRQSDGKQAVRRILGYLPQELGLYPDLSAEEFVDYLGMLKGLSEPVGRRRKVAAVLDLVGLSADKGRKLKTYSGGMKRRVGIAQAIVNDPQLLIVDEPTAGLDPEERIRFRNLLLELGRNRTVLLSTHIVEDIAQTCSRLAVQSHGRIIFAGTASELARQATGRVWTIGRNAGDPPPQDLQVIGLTHIGTGIDYRVVGELSGLDALIAQPAEPTLEDGYVQLMRSQVIVVRG